MQREGGLVDPFHVALGNEPSVDIFIFVWCLDRELSTHASKCPVNYDWQMFPISESQCDLSIFSVLECSSREYRESAYMGFQLSAWIRGSIQPQSRMTGDIGRH